MSKADLPKLDMTIGLFFINKICKKYCNLVTNSVTYKNRTKCCSGTFFFRHCTD